MPHVAKIRRKLRLDVERIYQAGLAAVDPRKVVQGVLRRTGNLLQVGSTTFDLAQFDNVIVLAFGKAAAVTAHAIERVLGGFPRRGIVITKYGHAPAMAGSKLEVREAGHPIPDDHGLAAAEQVLALAQAAGRRDLVLVAISGGGSALLPLPAAGISLAEKQATTSLLLNCGATIQELNTVRKHLSRVKGGCLGRAIAPAPAMSLVLSDVIGDPPEVIASGPTVPDPTTFADALDIVRRYDLASQLPAAVMAHLHAGAEGRIPETPKPGDRAFNNARWLILGNNSMALRACEETARSLGYHTLVLTSALRGEARELGQLYPALAHDVLKNGWPVATPACILCGGEPTVRIRGAGKGGRNQELALAAARGLADTQCAVLAAIGTDGTDGPTDAAGAVVDDTTLERANREHLSLQQALQENDAYPLLQRLGDLVKTGPTYTNVMDLHILLVEKC